MGQKGELLPPVIGLTGKAGAGKDSFYRLVLAPRGYRRIALADAVRGLALGLALIGHAASRTLPAAYADFSALAVSGALLRTDGENTWLDVSAYYYTWYGEKKSPEVRRILQHLGTEVGRSLDPGIWVYAALGEIRRIVEAGGRVAVTDVRYPNEAAALRGDTAYLRKIYEALDKNNAHPLIRESLTRTWHGGGLVVPQGMGAIIRVVRDGEGLEGELGEHASERAVDEIEPDHTIRASSLRELKALGDELAGPVEAYIA